MKKRNKILALLLAMTMCGTAMAGCGSDKESSEATNAVSTEKVNAETIVATETAAAEPLKNVDIYPLESDKTFTVVTQSNIFTESDTTIVTKKMEEATGVSVKWQYLTGEQFSLALTGKEMPDAAFLFSGLDKASVYEYGQADYFVNFMDYLDIMPNFAALIESNPEVLEVVQNDDGSVYCLPHFLATSASSNNVLYYRTDMMKEIGWEKVPATTDEFLQFLKDLQAHYGATDPDFVAFNAYQPSYMDWNVVRVPNFFFPSFGELVQTDLTMNSKEEVVLGAATEQYKYYLEFMNELWNSGAFNTNIYTQDPTASKALSAEGHVAVSPTTTGFTLSCFASGNFDLAVMEPLTSEYWNTQHWYQAPACKWGRVSVISKQCEDIETMVKWFDAWYAPADNPLNEEGSIYAITPWLGEIGVDYAFDDASGVYTELEHEGIDKGKFASTQGFSTALYAGFEDGLFPYSQDPNTATGVKGHGTKNNLWPYAETPTQISALSLTQDENDIYNDAWADIDAYLDEMTAKFITGELNIDENWETYLTTLDKMGLQDVIDVYEAAYARSKAK